MGNMFKAVKAKNVKEYLASVPPDRQAAIHFLHGFIQKAAPSLKPHFATNMLGYGSFKCLNHAKKEISWPVVAMANQKQYITVFVCAMADGKNVAESHKKELGKVSVGRSCISFRRLEDVNLPALKRVVQLAAKHPGLAGIGASSKKAAAKR